MNCPYVPLTSPVTRGAVSRGALKPVTGHTPSHLKGAHPLHPLHFRHRPVAGGAVDTSPYVPLVGEVDMVGEVVHPLPDYRLFLLDMRPQLLHLRTVDGYDAVAGHASRQRRDAGAG